VTNIDILPEDRSRALRVQAIIAKVWALRFTLVKQGAVIARETEQGRLSWRLRYRATDPRTGKCQHRTLGLGTNLDLAVCVTTLLAAFRNPPLQTPQQMLRQAMGDAVAGVTDTINRACAGTGTTMEDGSGPLKARDGDTKCYDTRGRRTT
jgi:hypothetical protein